MSAIRHTLLRFFTALVFTVSAFLSGHAQVASDDCEETAANEYAVNTSLQPFHMPLTYIANWDPGACGNLDRDAFGWFTATSDSTSITILPNNNADVSLQIFSGDCVTHTLLACIDNGGVAGLEAVTIHTVPNDPYIIRVQVYSDSVNAIPFAQLIVQQTPPPPVNSDPCSAIALTVTDSCNGVSAGTNISSVTTADIDNPCEFAVDATGEGGDVWFTAVVPDPQNGHLIIDTQCDVEMDGAMSVYTSPGGCADHAGFIFLDCNDDGSSSGNGMPQLIIDTGALAGDTLYIRFWAYYGAEENFKICASDNVTTLPVDFIAFQAEANDGVVDITWSTATEQNSDHFVVERSTDNSVFQAIGELPAAGESSNQHDYSYTDVAPPAGTVYYRVIEVDHDGSSMTTNTAVAFPAAVPAVPLLYPNPALDQVNVAFTAERDGDARITVIDAVGRVLLEQDVPGRHGRRAAQVDLHGLVQGYYAVRIALPSGEVLRTGGFIKR